MTSLPIEAVATRLRELRSRRYVPASEVEPPPEWTHAPRPSGIERPRGSIEVIETRFGEAVAEVRFMVTCQCGKRWWQPWPLPEVDQCPRCRAFVEITVAVPILPTGIQEYRP